MNSEEGKNVAHEVSDKEEKAGCYTKTLGCFIPLILACFYFQLEKFSLWSVIIFFAIAVIGGYIGRGIDRIYKKNG